MSWEDCLKKFYTPKADSIKPRNLSEPFVARDNTTNWRDKLTPEVQAKIAEQKKRFGETMASVPRQELKIKRPPSTGPNIKQEILDREQKKLEAAWAEKQKLMQEKRMRGGQIDRVKEKLQNATTQVQAVMNQIKQAKAQKHQNLADALDRINAEQKFQDIKNKLKEAGLNNELAQLEALQNMTGA